MKVKVFTLVPASLLLAVSLLLAEQANATPCYVPVIPSNKLEKVISINQFATENMLRLGLHEKLIATAYPDDEVDPSLVHLLEGIPQLSEKWPTHEQLMLLQPDLLYLGFPAGFQVGSMGTQDQWQAWGVSTLVSASYCPLKNRQLQWDDIWQDTFELARLFEVTSRAKQLKTLATAQLPSATSTQNWRVLHFDGGGETARVSGGFGAVDLMIRLAGAQNVASDMQQRWGTWNWETVVYANPEVISIAASNFSDPKKLIDYLTSHPLLKHIDAVKHQRFVVMPFSDTVASPRLINGINHLNQQLVKFSQSSNQGS